MVTTFLPATEPMSVWQERSATPSICTVQAPHRPAPQPYLVPVRPTWSRMAQSSGVLGSASTATCRLFKVNETMFPPLASAFSCPDVRSRREQLVDQTLGLTVLQSSNQVCSFTWEKFQ